MLPLLFLSLVQVWPIDAPTQPPGSRATAMAEAEDTPADSKLLAAVSRLKELGVVSDPDYWEANARKGRTCDGGMVAELLINTAAKFQPADNLEAAVQVLKENKILQNKEATEYWETKAVQGTKCPGRFVGLILIKIAEVL